MRCSSSSIVRWLLAKWLHRRCTTCSRCIAVGAGERAEDSGLIHGSQDGARESYTGIRPSDMTTPRGMRWIVCRRPGRAGGLPAHPNGRGARAGCRCLTQGSAAVVLRHRDDVVAPGDDHELVAAVLRPAVLRILRAHRLLVTVRDDVDA